MEDNLDSLVLVFQLDPLPLRSPPTLLICFCPSSIELSVARTAVLDYFQSPAQVRLEKIFAWEEDFILKPGKNLIKYLRMVGKEIALPIVRPHTQLCDSQPITSHLVGFPDSSLSLPL
jgi:hypothetical protein